MASARLPALAKLPLSARTQVRDAYEANKAEWEKELSDLFGAEWKFDINPAALYPYCKEDQNKNCFGYSLRDYAGGFVDSMKTYWIPENGEEGKEELNSCAYTHTITVDVDEGNKHGTNRAPYRDIEIRDGKVVLLFHADWFGSNASTMGGECLTKALDVAPAPPS